MVSLIFLHIPKGHFSCDIWIVYYRITIVSPASFAISVGRIPTPGLTPSVYLLVVHRPHTAVQFIRTILTTSAISKSQEAALSI